MPGPADLAGRAARWALPSPCVLCGLWTAGGLCAACRTRFVDTQPPRCPRCALPSPDGRVCGRCLRQAPPHQRCVAAVDYGFPWDGLIARFKFQDQPELAGLLAGLLHRAVQRASAPTPHGVLPVPVGPQRLVERGYDQAWELARRVAARQRLPAWPRALQRLHDGAHQVGLTRAARQRNVQDALWVPPEAAARLRGADVALVDDVMTTGATAAAATEALLAAGAASVQVWVLARTPPPAD